MEDILLNRPLPFLRNTKPADMEPFNPAKLRSVSTSTPILTREMLSSNATPKRSMSTGFVNDSGFDESFSESFCSDRTMCVDTPNTVCKNERWTPISNLYSYRGDSVLDDSFDSSPFSALNVNSIVESPGSSFFCDKCSAIEDEGLRRKKQRHSIDIPSYSLDLTHESCELEPSLYTAACTSGLEEHFKVLQPFLPKNPDRVIGRKMGLEHVDIVSELSDRNISCAKILQYLEPVDLCRMCEVSREWKSACEEDPPSRKRKRSYSSRFISHVADKENTGKKSPPRPFRGLTDSTNTLAPLQMVAKQKNQLTACLVKKDLFSKVASSLKNEENLRKCPKCSKVSKVLPVQERGQCQNADCLFDFCTKCFYEFHDARPCTIATKKTKTDSIGSKKSKKYLRRL